MVFHSAAFGFFLIATLALFWVLSPHRRARTIILLAASYTFYASWHRYYLALVVFSTVHRVSG